MKQTTILLILATLLLVTGVTLAMDSDHYRLDWFTPLTGSGGGAAHSTNYAVNLTVGQSAIGASSSTNHGGCLGYWCGGTAAVAAPYRVYLPLMLRNYP